MTAILRRAVARTQWDLVAITALAFLARIVYRLAQGEDAFLNHGYSFYLELAGSALRGEGFCADGGVDCAVRVPVYPALVAAFLQLDWLYPGLPIVQAALSACRCLIAYGIACTLFDRRAGIAAAAIVAVNPYSVAHSTALQDTSLFNLLMALGIYLLLLSREPRRETRLSLAGGVVLGLATLTSVRLVLFVPLAILWAAMPAEPGRRWRLRPAVLVAIPVMLLVGGWVVRNWTLVGEPVITTEAGLSLWVANNPSTDDFLPERSIDEVYDAAFLELSAERKAQLAGARSELEVDRILGRWAVDDMLSQPLQTLFNMGGKVAWAFSGQLSPARDAVTQGFYSAFVIPLHLLAVIGWWRIDGTRRHVLICLLFLAFAITTAVFWSHTSHKSTLHLFLAVYAGFAITRWWPGPAAAASQSPVS